MPRKKKTETKRAHGVESRAWPTVQEQLAAAKARRGSALEKLIRQNQDFHFLRSEEAHDKIGLPLWLRVHWRKQHPEGKYSAEDPSGGYPLSLRRIHAWMLSHQNLRTGKPRKKG